jgi:uncharacterized heparinase superfamily protein
MAYRLNLLWNTVRHLKPVQITARAKLKLPRPKPDLRPAPALRRQGGRWTPPARRRQSQFGADSFSFLNRKGSLAEGWDSAEREKLWRYNLHYFDDLNAEGAETRSIWHRDLIARWIAENSPGRGTGWEPYPTSVRIVNWIKWALAGGTFEQEAADSLAIQTRWLSRRLEYHLLGNHLFANAKALVFAGCFFEGQEAQGWLAKGSAILREQVPEQILPDGGHFELSTMYHALALEDVLDLVNLSRAYPDNDSSIWRDVAASLDGRVGGMREWLAAMTHPDGEISFFNDAAIGIAPSPAELENYALRMGLAPLPPMPAAVWLRDSGYIRIESGPCVVMIDVARIGPDYLPGHAHADTLSFEMSLNGRRVVVNSGTSTYAAGEERLRQRGTAAHNTVVMDGRNSSEVWGGFRVARRARPLSASLDADGRRITVKGAHDGYCRLHGSALHERTWTVTPDGLTIADRVGWAESVAEARFHFHPDITLKASQSGAAVEVWVEDEMLGAWTVDGGTSRLQEASWCPEFGVDRCCAVLCVDLRNATGEVQFRWDNAG